MCGIAGYIGKEKNVFYLIDILKRLEYRGYDSCGLAVIRKERIFLKKTHGKIDHLKNMLKNNFKFSLGIAHTRWATHGTPNYRNAHPHWDCTKKIFLVHNGIIENYQLLKNKLQKRGHKFNSQTDTEVIAHLIEEYSVHEPFLEALRKTVNILKGSFAIAVIYHKERAIFFAKKDSPLVLGKLPRGFILASDIPAIASITYEIINLEDGWVGVLKEDGVEIFDFQKKKVKPHIEKIPLLSTRISKERHPHFMLKEIFEQPYVLHNLVSSYVKRDKIYFKDIKLSPRFLRSLNKIHIFACGTAYHAGLVAKYFLEKNCSIDAEIDVSSEARYRALRLNKKSLILAISQSGETADTLAAVRKAKEQGAHILGICNVLGSTLTKEAQSLIYTQAGPEIGVASTKAYIAQVFSLMLFSLYLAKLRQDISLSKFKILLSELKLAGTYQVKILKSLPRIKKIAKQFSHFGCFLFLGRGINYPSALEGALKLKEISYIPAEGYPAGEMKHGPIALIDEYRAVVCIALYDELYPKIVSNIQEIKARKGKVLAIVNERDSEVKKLANATIQIPYVKSPEITPLLVALPLQLFAYFVAKNLGCEIDQPRNLAKSVTVE